MRRWWSWLGLNLGKRAGIVSVVGLLVTLSLGLGIVHLSDKKCCEGKNSIKGDN